MHDHYLEIFETIESQLAASSGAWHGHNPVLAIGGVPGAGKTTFARGLHTYLVDRGHDAVIIQADWLLAAVRLPLWKLPLAGGAGLLGLWLPRVMSMESLMRVLVALFADPRSIGRVRAALGRLAESAEADGLEETLMIRPPDPAEDTQHVRLRKHTFVILEGALARTMLRSTPMATLLMDIDATEARRRLVERGTRDEGMTRSDAENRARYVASDLTVSLTRRWSQTHNYVFALDGATPILTVVNPVPSVARPAMPTSVSAQTLTNSPGRK